MSWTPNTFENDVTTAIYGAIFVDQAFHEVRTLVDA